MSKNNKVENGSYTVTVYAIVIVTLAFHHWAVRRLRGPTKSNCVTSVSSLVSFCLWHLESLKGKELSDHLALPIGLCSLFSLLLLTLLWCFSSCIFLPSSYPHLFGFLLGISRYLMHGRGCKRQLAKIALPYSLSNRLHVLNCQKRSWTSLRLASLHCRCSLYPQNTLNGRMQV